MSIRKSAASAAAALIASGAFAGSAGASAVGIEPFNEGTIDTPAGSYDIPRGELDHGITGSGLHVESDAAGFTSAAPVCNWTMTYEHADVNGAVYRSQSTGLISDCSTNVNAPGVTWSGDAVPGTSCAVLSANGAVLARQCHSITEN